ncbi:MAG: hypothetical protein ABI920_11270 [Casimicrobiaceae bacterium]
MLGGGNHDLLADTIILGVIGILWVLMDRFIFTVIERRTVARWGLLQR